MTANRKTRQAKAFAALFAGVSLLALAGAAHAQDQSTATTTGGTDSEAVTLQPVEVTDTRTDGEATATSPVEGYVAHRSATGTKTDAALIEVPQSVSVITPDEIEARGAQSVDQALQYSAGVITTGSDPRFDTPTIRGFDASSSIYLDGLKVMRSNNQPPALDTYGMERVEVLRGPSSVLYGQASPGGMINLVSKRPTWDPVHEISLSAGSNDDYEGDFDFGGALSPSSNFAYRVTGVVKNAETQMDTVENNRYYLAPALTWQPGEDTSLTLLAKFQRNEAGTPVGMPASHSLTGDKLSTSTYLGEPSLDDSQFDMSTIGAEFEHKFNSALKFRENARYMYQNYKYSGTYLSAFDEATDTATRGAQIIGEDHTSANSDSQLLADFNTGDLSHSAVAGLDLRYAHGVTDNIFATLDAASATVNIYNPTYHDNIDLTPWYTSHGSTRLTQQGLYGQDQMKLNNWILTFGLRYDWAQQQGYTDSNFGDTTNHQRNEALTGRAGLSYQFDNGIAPYVSYATSFDPVIGNYSPARGGAAFDPSTGKQWETGVKYQPKGFDSFITAAVYDLRQTNVTAVDPDNSAYSIQTGEVHSKGLELEATASLDKGLNLTGSYTHNIAEISEGDNEGNQAAMAPMDMASVWLDKTFQEGSGLDGFGFGGGVRYIGDRFNDNAHTYELPDVTLLDAAVHYTFNDITASLNLTNITDKTYVANCSSFGCFYGQGRTVLGKVSYKW
ncbi:TonB-dependent siderophore receptor [Radicibacter daui]|uniref:TonB-dependent siderophore receptor n=1 Tax=Radicibacter daui TaxID=3064829 RepID=UPI004046DC0F